MENGLAVMEKDELREYIDSLLWHYRVVDALLKHELCKHVTSAQRK